MSRKRVKPTEAGEKARAWRQKAGLSIHALAEATGYSLEAIYQYERGKRHDGTKLSEFAWQRYEMACAGVAAELSGRKFAW